MKHRNVVLPAVGILLFACAGWAQTTSLEGDVKAADGSPVKGALVKIDRKDIKGHYQVKTDKRGHYFYAGLQKGVYKITLEVESKDVDSVDNVHTQFGDPTPINFDMKMEAQRQQETTKQLESGNLSDELKRQLSPEQKAALEKAAKERTQSMAKNKALNDAFGGGMEALRAKQYDTAVQQFSKASEMDANQHVVWAQLAESYVGVADSKTGPEHDEALAKALDAFQKAMTLKPDDASYHNNYALALAKSKKFDDAQAELGKAAQIDPPNAGKYYYNLGALLVNNGQTEPAGQAFKKAIEADPNYADAQYQYGVYLVAKAKVSADGKVTPVDGTREAFQKYLELKPDGAFAVSAKAMLDSIGGTLDTSYQNPNAKKKSKKN
jgi:tetratricopeptide (TPR) repeat protein